jgi:hypothetical protein
MVALGHGDERVAAQCASVLCIASVCSRLARLATASGGRAADTIGDHRVLPHPFHPPARGKRPDARLPHHREHVPEQVGLRDATLPVAGMPSQSPRIVPRYWFMAAMEHRPR